MPQHPGRPVPGRFPRVGARPGRQPADPDPGQPARQPRTRRPRTRRPRTRRPRTRQPRTRQPRTRQPRTRQAGARRPGAGLGAAMRDGPPPWAGQRHAPARTRLARRAARPDRGRSRRLAGPGPRPHRAGRSGPARRPAASSSSPSRPARAAGGPPRRHPGPRRDGPHHRPACRRRPAIAWPVGPRPANTGTAARAGVRIAPIIGHRRLARGRLRARPARAAGSRDPGPPAAR